MATIGRDPNGHKRILYVEEDHSRPTIRLGKVSQKQAEAFKVKLEDLVQAKRTGTSMKLETTQWLADLPDSMHTTLAEHGLVTKRRPKGPGETLGAFLDRYIASRIDAKPATVLVFGRARKHLLEHFKAETPLASIGPAEADAWRLYLIGLKLAANTVRRSVGIARQFFNAAKRQGLIDRNPFEGLAAAVGSNEKRQHYVDLDTTQKILDACPDARWRLIVVLCRYAGLRCPSEITALRWGDVLWDQDRFRVRSCKTEHHEHGQSRMVPLFREVERELLAVSSQAEPGDEYVISRYGRPVSALRGQFEKILEQAGVESWPKLFVNMRASAATDLSKRFGSFAACAWLGHGPTIAAKHYWQVTEADFQKAITPVGGAAQNPAQYTAEQGGTAGNTTPHEATKNAVLTSSDTAFPGMQTVQVGDAGLGPATSCV